MLPRPRKVAFELAPDATSVALDAKSKSSEAYCLAKTPTSMLSLRVWSSCLASRAKTESSLSERPANARLSVAKAWVATNEATKQAMACLYASNADWNGLGMFHTARLALDNDVVTHVLRGAYLPTASRATDRHARTHENRLGKLLVGRDPAIVE